MFFFGNLPNPEVEGKRQDHFVEPDGQPDELADKLLGGLLVDLLVGVFDGVVDGVHRQTWKAPPTVDFLSP